MTGPQQLRARADVVLQLHEEGALDEALEGCDALLSDLDDLDSADPVIRETLFATRFERGLLLTELGDLAGAASAYEQAASTPYDAQDPDQRHEVAMAVLSRGICLDRSGQPDAAVDAYEQLVRRFGDADDPVTREQVVRGRVNRAAALLAVGRGADAIAAAGTLIDELDPADALQAEQLVMAARIRASALRSLDRADEAVASLRVVDRCGDQHPAVRLQVAQAQRERAELLAEVGRPAEAVALVEETLARSAGDGDPFVIEVLDDLVATRDGLRGGGGKR